MFTIKKIHHKNNKVIEILDSISGTKAKIQLSYGASLDELNIRNIKVITNLYPLDYKKTYPSSILFPFANRINDGQFNFNGSNYNLQCNEKQLNNAIHGLVYNKAFLVDELKKFENHAEIKLYYEELNPPTGYPFKFRVELTYKLTNEFLSLKINVINLDDKKLPFTVGWHPYFKSVDLDKSKIQFDCIKKIKCNKNNIALGFEPFNSKMPLSLRKRRFDDAFVLENPDVKFFTPEYDLVLKSSEKESFLQLYTPMNTNAIAIEPMTGVSDSFNNKIGLKKLSSGQSYSIEWQVSIKIK
ncbi:MAG: aldose 1-epimerase [Flavobacteriaceae bacterium]